jgi:hypothetical protein
MIPAPSLRIAFDSFLNVCTMTLHRPSSGPEGPPDDEVASS